MIGSQDAQLDAWLILSSLEPRYAVEVPKLRITSRGTRFPHAATASGKSRIEIKSSLDRFSNEKEVVAEEDMKKRNRTWSAVPIA